MKLIHGLVLTVIDFCNSLYYYQFSTFCRLKPELNTRYAYFGDPRYLADLLSRFSTERDMSLRSIEFDRLDEPMISRHSTVYRCFEQVLQQYLLVGTIVVPTSRYQQQVLCTRYYAPKLHNQLPHFIRQIDTVQLFKKNDSNSSYERLIILTG